MPTETSPPKRGYKPNKPEPVEPVQTTEQIVRIPLTVLHPFSDHPYGIREDQAMQDTLDSVKQNGVVVPARQIYSHSASVGRRYPSAL